MKLLIIHDFYCIADWQHLVNDANLRTFLSMGLIFTFMQGYHAPLGLTKESLIVALQFNLGSFIHVEIQNARSSKFYRTLGA